MDHQDERRDGRSREDEKHHRHHHKDSRHHDRDDRRRRRSHSRSRSPDRKRRRSGSPRSHHRHHHSKHSQDTKAATPQSLPFSARPLRKSDLCVFKPLFSEFLFIQKSKDIRDMDEREIKGRWKSFVGKWNRGELAEGWYDPEMFERARSRAMEEEEEGGGRGEEQDESHEVVKRMDPDKPSESDGREEDDDDEYGPVLPGRGSGKFSGPGIPNRQDLSMRDEQRLEDREASLSSLRQARKADRILQKERLDEMLPRAEAGTRERKLEKKQLLNEKLKSFRDRSPGAAVTDDMPDSEIMGGGGGDELEEFKKEKERQQRKKTEREIRREEMERIKREEMEERKRRWREKEEGTVEVLRELARQKFGG